MYIYQQYPMGLYKSNMYILLTKSIRLLDYHHNFFSEHSYGQYLQVLIQPPRELLEQHLGDVRPKS